MSQEIKYRPEIDGLRTIAILGVILFHLRPELLRGGFLGVDVFFVISGFLITTIIYKQVTERRFSIWSFWMRRFKRLYPALVVTVFVTMIFGLFVLPQPERGAMPLQALAAILSFSNILLWKTTGGYWDSSSENISLLHTWSLSLEEQFYICFPLFVFLSHLLFKKHVGKLVVALFITSLILCIVFTDLRRSATFYLLPTRMWELLIGGLLAIYMPDFTKVFRSITSVTAIHFLAITLILGSYIFIENGNGFPGFYPLFPCVGTFLILCIRDSRSVVTRFLSLGPMVYIGKISYSLYLWHWPVIVFGHYLWPDPNLAILLLVAFGAASLSYHHIEQRFRGRIERPQLWVFASSSTLVFCFGAFFLIPMSPLLKSLGNFDTPVALTRGWEYEATDEMRDLTFVPRISENMPKLVVTGSSHARVLCKPVDEYSQDNGYQFFSFATSGIGITSIASPEAERINRRRMELIRQVKPEIVVLAGMWSSELGSNGAEQRMYKAIEELASISNKVIVIAQVPLVELPLGYKNGMRKYLVASSLSGQSISLKSSPKVAITNQIVANLIKKLNNDRVEYIDPSILLTTDTGDVRFIDGVDFLYSDWNHLNDRGAEVLFNSLVREHLGENESCNTLRIMQDGVDQPAPAVESSLEGKDRAEAKTVELSHFRGQKYDVK